MTQEPENLSAHQSLDLIQTMIKQAQGNIRKNAIHFLLWGWVVTIGNLGMYFLIQIQYSDPHMIWIITFPAAFLSAYLGYRQGRKSKVKTHLDTIYMWLWISSGIVFFTFIYFGSKINFQINPIILLITSIPTMVSGIVLRFKPLVIGGVLFWLFGIVCFNLDIEMQLLVSSAAILCGYLIPGYMLNAKKDNNV